MVVIIIIQAKEVCSSGKENYEKDFSVLCIVLSECRVCTSVHMNNNVCSVCLV